MWVNETQTYNNGINDWTCNLTLNAIFLPKSKIVRKFIEVQKIKLNNICSNSFFGQNMTSFFYFFMDFNEIFRDSSSCHMVLMTDHVAQLLQGLFWPRSRKSAKKWIFSIKCTRRLLGRLPPKLDIGSIWFLVCESMRHRPKSHLVSTEPLIWL